MLLSLVSHASTTALRHASFPADEAIDAIGVAKAKALAGSLPIAAHVWCSAASRTLQTATALALDATPDRALDDCDYGRWAGRRLADVQDTEPAQLQAWLTEPDASAHGGESLREMQQRISAWMAGLDKQVDHAIALTHPAVIRLAILEALGANLESFWRIDVSPLCMTTLRFSNHRWTLVSTGIQMGTRRN